MVLLLIDILYGQGSIPKGSRFYGAGYIGRNHAHPRNHGAVSNETKDPVIAKSDRRIEIDSYATLPTVATVGKGNTRNRQYYPGVPPR